MYAWFYGGIFIAREDLLAHYGLCMGSTFILSDALETIRLALIVYFLKNDNQLVLTGMADNLLSSTSSFASMRSE